MKLLISKNGKMLWIASKARKVPFSGSNNRIDENQDYFLMILDSSHIWTEHKRHQMNDDEPYHFFPLDLTYVNQGAHNQELNHLMNLIFDHNDDNDNEWPILSLLFTYPILLLFTE